MAFTLILGNRNYSSWSMRAWLLFRHVGAEFDEVWVDLYKPGSRETVRALGGESGMVPVLKDGDTVVWDTLAIAETLCESFPAVWPSDKALRARARTLCNEMHSGFTALRGAMPCNTRGRNRVAKITADVERDIQRVGEIWTRSLESFGGPWLLGEFGIVDIFFAPVATRFQTYDVPITGPVREYADRLLAHPLVAEWIELGKTDPTHIEGSELPSR